MTIHSAITSVRARLSGDRAGTAVAGSDGQDRRIARKPRWARYAALVVAMAAAGSGAFWLMTQGGNVYRAPLAQFTLGSVRQGAFEDYIAVRGTVAPLLTAYLTTDQGGTVKQVLAEDGAAVKKGQKLLVLSNPALELQVAAQQLSFEQTRFKYQQELLTIQHQIAKLKTNLERYKVLLDGGALAASTYRQEQQDLEYNEKLLAATVASHEAEQKVRATQLTGDTSGGRIDITRAGVEALTIRAPMDGQLTALEAEIGQSKPAGAVLGQVNSQDRFKLMAQIDEFYLGQIAVGQGARFTIEGREFRARVAKVYPQVISGTFKADFHFDGPAPGGIHAGQAVEMKIELGGARQAVMLPNGPFYQDTGGNWVFVVMPDGGSAVRRAVRLGRRNPEFVEVTDGLRPGERAIISAYEAFSKMDRIEFSSGGSLQP